MTATSTLSTERLDTPLAAPRSLRAGVGALVTALRPRQWLKNGLVVAAPFAAGRWGQLPVAEDTLLALVVLTATASGGYLINDVSDRERDRLHPDKRHRPIASGRLPVGVAAAVGVVLLVAGPALAWSLHRPGLAAVALLYAALTAAYSRALKRVAVLEVLCVATGFVLRPLAGAAATGVSASGWFLAVCCTGALMVTLGKRTAEIRLPGAVTSRPVLAGYTDLGLRLARTATAVVMLGCYLGWVITRPGGGIAAAAVSGAAVTGAVARFCWLADRGYGGEPELLVARDRVLGLCALVWVAAFVAGPTGL